MLSYILYENYLIIKCTSEYTPELEKLGEFNATLNAWIVREEYKYLVDKLSNYKISHKKKGKYRRSTSDEESEDKIKYYKSFAKPVSEDESSEYSSSSSDGFPTPTPPLKSKIKN